MNVSLKVAIVRTGRTQRAIARRARIAESRLSNIIHGWSAPTSAERKALAAELKEPVDELFADLAAAG